MVTKTIKSSESPLHPIKSQTAVNFFIHFINFLLKLAKFHYIRVHFFCLTFCRIRGRHYLVLLDRTKWKIFRFFCVPEMILVNCRRVSSVDLFFLKTRCVFSSAFSKKNLAPIRNHRMHICILRDPSHVFKLQTRIWCKARESMKPLTSAGKLAICAKCRKTFNCSPFFRFYYFINVLSA